MGIYSVVGMLDHMTGLVLVFKEMYILLSRMGALIYVPTNSVYELLGNMS